MKKCLLPSLFLILSLSSFAQIFDFEALPNPSLVSVEFGVGNPLTIPVPITITNTSTNEDDLVLNWAVIDIDMPLWEVAICDFNNCYTPGVNFSPKPNILPFGESNILSAYFYPEDINGIGVLTLQVWADNNPNINDTLVFILDYGENEGFKLVQGNVSWDDDGNCNSDPSNIDLSNWLIKAEGDLNFYGTTDEDGNYSINALDGAYTLSAIPPSPYWSVCNNNIPAVLILGDTVIQNFVTEAIFDCPFLHVDISTPRLRRCFDNRYYVNYCNDGTLPAEGAYIEVLLDEYLSVTGASILIDGQVGNLLQFNLGDIPVGECGAFYIDTYLDCDSTILGQTHCVEAKIYPDTICLPTSSLWSGAEIEVSGVCIDDEIRFKIENIGTAPSAENLQYLVIEDHVILMSEEFDFLAAGDSIVWYQAVEGTTMHLESEQEPYFPEESHPSVTIELCGEGNSWSLGNFNLFPHNDGSPFVSIDCQENIGSYDPNDKQAFPRGVSDEHFIEKDTELEYMIRFQNTGTDTAFTVVIIDTLSEFLDVETLRVGASSHPFNYTIQGDDLLKFTFDNIMLPDSNINELASHGFIKFKIEQKANNEIGTVIQNKADIYFDFNSAVLTNTIFHTIGENLAIVQTSVVFSPELNLRIYPNPFTQSATIELNGHDFETLEFSLFDQNGRLVQRETFHGAQFVFDRKALNSGLYFYQINAKGQRLASGKMMVH